MSEIKAWAFPPQLQPRQADLKFDLEAALRSVVLLHAAAPEDAFTAAMLGTERIGNGVVIRYRESQYVLTIGYLVIEAESLWLTTSDARVVAGHPLAYDQETGYGLIMPLTPLQTPALELGSAEDLSVGSPVVAVAHGGIGHALNANVIATREFAGYWEYLIDRALFTAPPHPHWSGAALLAENGRLCGVGSLLVQEQVAGETFDANMFVPIDLLHPILDEMTQRGGVTHPPRPWLGIHAAEQEGRVIVAGVIKDGPADRAGLLAGDAILQVAGEAVDALPPLFRRVWGLGAAGSNIPLMISRHKKTLHLVVRSANRQDFLKKPQRH